MSYESPKPILELGVLFIGCSTPSAIGQPRYGSCCLAPKRESGPGTKPHKIKGFLTVGLDLAITTLCATMVPLQWARDNEL